MMKFSMPHCLSWLLFCGVTALSASLVHAFGGISPGSGALMTSSQAPRRFRTPLRLFPSHLTEALKKPSKTLTVGMDFFLDDDSLGEGDVATLSMQTRKLKASTIWMTSQTQVITVAKEQAGAQGNFPGPCPIVWHGDLNDILLLDHNNEALLEAVDAVVVSPSDDITAVAAQCSQHNVGIIWRVETLDDMTSILKKEDNSNDPMVGILLDADHNNHMDRLLEEASSHKNAIVIVSMPCMQADNAEISRARSFSRGSVHSIMLQKAIVGDAEDVEYCTFAVAGLTGKQSSTFNMTGLTGSTNGHFGGVASGSATSKTWLRKQRAEQPFTKSLE